MRMGLLGLDFLAGYKLLVWRSAYILPSYDGFRFQIPSIKEFLPLTPLTGGESWGAVVASFIRIRTIEKGKDLA
jgi:hypothetical protein